MDKAGMARRTLGFAAAVCAAIPQTIPAEPSDPNIAAYPMFQVGEIRPRTTLEAFQQGRRGIFSIGLETIERDYVSYQAVEPYIVPLGFGRARLMAGWANIEKRRGVYDFSQILAITRDLKRKGVTPWVGLTYGNPAVYGPGGGGVTLGGDLPSSPEAKAAWLRFVTALVTTLGREGLVSEWEIWNEVSTHIGADRYAPFAVDTINAVMRAQPTATIDLGAFLADFDPSAPEPGFMRGGIDYAEMVFRAVKAGTNVPPAQMKVTYHPYQYNPDLSYGAGFDQFRALVQSYGWTISMGENGTPSTNQQVLALRNMENSEDSQAKYVLRRIVNDFARGIETGYFGLSEMHYASAVGGKSTEWTYTKNNKGVLQTGAYAPTPPYGDKRVLRPKSAYRAMQNAAAVFDQTVQPLATAPCGVPFGYRAYAFRKTGADGKPLYGLAVWRYADRPNDVARAEAITIRCNNLPIGRAGADGKVQNVQLANLLNGAVYNINPNTGQLKRAGNNFAYTGAMVIDSPMIIADAGFVPFY